jgi:hypothetical protein
MWSVYQYIKDTSNENNTSKILFNIKNGCIVLFTDYDGTTVIMMKNFTNFPMSKNMLIIKLKISEVRGIYIEQYEMTIPIKQIETRSINDKMINTTGQPYLAVYYPFSRIIDQLKLYERIW